MVHSNDGLSYSNTVRWYLLIQSDSIRNMMALFCRPVQGCLPFAFLLLPHDSTHIIHSPLMLSGTPAAALQEGKSRVGQLRELDWPVLVCRLQEHEGHAGCLPVIKDLRHMQLLSNMLWQLAPVANSRYSGVAAQTIH